ncbi:LPD38 domain-containing protein [Salinisphaera hydrothermalis]|uniref:Uncharacterized protein n=1 Tax=Salinisphaera hydrothermalis (strain C41B8) TaxID=1304275 RepID=A0A084INL0_SALHC|nr:LPD38 domain-containing protein [Salinisphaera hydrothermalis]KEZ78294.1 hypothetical protein C41B8_05313 [Salinisphaera hydrothermalis C41B8]
MANGNDQPGKLSAFRQRYPQYNDMSDDALASALHKNFYSDIPEDQFRQQVGLQPTAPAKSGGDGFLSSVGDLLSAGPSGPIDSPSRLERETGQYGQPSQPLAAEQRDNPTPARAGSSDNGTSGPQMSAWHPSLLQRINGFFGSPDRARAANAVAAEEYAKRTGKPKEQFYTSLGGHRPILNPEGENSGAYAEKAAQVLGGEAKHLPADVANSVLRTIRGGDRSVKDSWIDKAIDATNPDSKAYQDPNFDSLRGIGQSLAFSAVGLGSFLAGSAAGNLVAPGVGTAAGATAAGAAAYRNQFDSFMDQLHDHADRVSQKLNGHPLTQQEWGDLYDKSKNYARLYGGAEALTEPAGEAMIGSTLMKSLAKKQGVGEVAHQLARTFGLELPTETITQVLQNRAEYGTGMTRHKVSAGEALRQVAVPTIAVTGLLGGGSALTGSAIRRASQSGSQAAGDTKTAKASPDPDAIIEKSMRSDTPLSDADKQALVDAGLAKRMDNGRVMPLPRMKRRAKQILDGEVTPTPEEQPSVSSDSSGPSGVSPDEAPAWQQTRRQFYQNPANMGRDHEEAVDQALRAGEPVSPQVMVDYPHLIEDQQAEHGAIDQATASASDVQQQSSAENGAEDQSALSPEEVTRRAREGVAKTASVPTMITQDMRRRLRDAGHSDDQIRQMTPQQAWDHLSEARQDQADQGDTARETPAQPDAGSKPAARPVKASEVRQAIGADVGDTVTPSGAIGHGKADTPYRVDDIDRRGHVRVTDTQDGSSTSWSRGELQRALNEGVTFTKADASGATSSDRSVPDSRRSVTTGRGDKVDVQGEFVDANDLVASHTAQGNVNPSFPESLQPRDRSRVSSQAQIGHMARNLDPELLDDTAKASDGAPIVGPDNVVESGNGRVNAIRHAYAAGNADAYRKFVERKAQRAGVDLSGMDNPVYVRRRTTAMDDGQRAEFARQANQSDLSQMSPAEQARSDAERLTVDDMALFDPSDNGNVLAASNDEFLRRFAHKIGDDEAASLRTGDGRWNKRMADRVQGAVFAKAYGDDRLLNLAAEESDPEIKNVLAGLQRAAPAFARARGADGSLGGIDTANILAEGADLVRDSRRRNQDLDELLRQQDAFSQTSPEVADAARFIDANIRSGKRLGEYFKHMADLTEHYARNGADSLFGDAVSAGDIVQTARQRSEAGDGQQAIRFSRPEQDGDLSPDERSGQEGSQQGGGRRAEAGRSESAGSQAGEVSQPQTAATNARGADQRTQFSRSAMKSVEANAARGREAMNKALLDKTTVHRAMYQPDLGWVDFEYGDEGGRVTKKGNRRGAKGISHILEARQRKDGMSLDDATHFLTETIPNTIARGAVTRRASPGQQRMQRATVSWDGNEVNLVKNPGSNAWLLTGYKRTPDATSAGNDVTGAMHPAATTARDEVGAGASQNSVTGGEGDGTSQFSRAGQFFRGHGSFAFDDQAVERRDAYQPYLQEALNKLGRHIPVTMMTIPPEQVTGDPSARGVEGMYTGTHILLFPGNIASKERAMKVLRHESMGHFGMQQILGQQFRPTMTQVKQLRDRSPAIQKLAEEVRNRYRRIDPDSDEFAEELIAVMAENKVDLPIMQRIKAAIQAFLRRLGLRKGEIGEDELNALIAQAGRYAYGKGRVLRIRPRPYTYSEPVPTYYSEMARVLSEKLPNRGPAEQMRQAIESYAKKGQIKPEELEWSGIQSWLDDQEGTVEKSDLLQALAERGVRTEETVLGSSDRDDAIEALVDEGGGRNYQDENGKYGYRWRNPSSGERVFENGFDSRDAADEALHARIGAMMEDGSIEPPATTGGVRYHEYTLPGGDNYRELLLQFPRRETDAQRAARDEATTRQRQAADAYNDVRDSGDTETTRARAQDLSAANDTRREAETAVINARRAYHSGHFEEPNIVAHLRMNERHDADGNRVLFLEEVQSDWHQEGRKRGYANHESNVPNYTVEETDTQWKAVSPDGQEVASVGKGVAAARQDAEEYLHRYIHDRSNEAAEEANRNAVLDAPFKKTWPLLAMKRAIRYAADKGIDRIAWTTGAQQAERYDLSKTIAKISYSEADDAAPSERGHLIAETHNGEKAINRYVARDDLPDYIGKEAADNLLQQEPQSNGTGFIARTLEGQQLSVGGEGMKAFYDQMLPKMTGKYIKKWGGRVGDMRVRAGDEEVGVHGFEITPEMRDAAFKGQPMFSRPPRRGDVRLVGRDENGNVRAAATVQDGKWLIVSRTGDMLGYGIKKAGNRQRAEELMGADGLTVGTEVPGQSDSSQADFQPNHLDSPEAGYFGQMAQTFVYKAQNKFEALKRLETAVEARTGERLKDEGSPYLQETLYHGRTRQAMDAFDESDVQPLLDALQKTGFRLRPVTEYVPDLDQDLAEKFGHLSAVDAYLYARHAPEANAKLAEINPGEEAMSGMSDDQAKRMTDALRGRGESDALDDVAGRVDRMTRATRDLLVDSGLEKKSTVDQWASAYDHYVPLKGEPGGPGKNGDTASRPGTGRGFDTRGSSSKHRLGRHSAAQNILANVVAGHYATITRAEKNKVGQSMLRFAQENPSDLWDIDQPMTKRMLDPVTGLVTQAPDPSQRNRDNVFVVRVNGVEHHVEFNENDTDAMRIAASLKNLGATEMGTALKLLHGLNGYLSLASTSLNPEFVISNFARDLQTAAINLNDTEASAMKRRIIADAASGKAYRAIRRHQKGQRDSEWTQYYQDFLDDGATTGWQEGYENLDQFATSLTKRLDREAPGTWAFAKRQGRNLFEFIGNANTAVENGVRLSAYIHARKDGVSRQRAAAMAKDLTVNFNRKGESADALNALYLFYNASIQGSARIMRAASSKKARRWMYGAVALGTALDVANRWVAGTDDDGENRYDRIPDYVKRMNWVVMLPPNTDMPDWVPGWARGPEGDYLKFPLPYGYNVLNYAGQKIGRAMGAIEGSVKNYNPASEAAGLMMSVMDAFNPIGASPTLLQLVSPTIADPLVQWAENKNFAGLPIHPEADPYGPPPPNYTLYYSGARGWSRWIAKELNMVSGGTEVQPGAVNISPELIDHFYDFATGGVGRFLAESADMPRKTYDLLAHGQDFNAYEIPFLGKVYGTPRTGDSRDLFYDRTTKLRYLKQEYELARSRGDRDRYQQLRQQFPGETRMLGMLDGLNKQLRDLKKRKDRVMNAKQLSDARKSEITDKIEDQQTKLYQLFNRRYRQTVLDQSGTGSTGATRTGS